MLKQNFKPNGFHESNHAVCINMRRYFCLFIKVQSNLRSQINMQIQKWLNYCAADRHSSDLFFINQLAAFGFVFLQLGKINCEIIKAIGMVKFIFYLIANLGIFFSLAWALMM